MTCSDWQDIRWSASSEWEVTSNNSNDRLTLAVYLSEKSPVTTLMTDLTLAVYLSKKSPVTTLMTDLSLAVYLSEKSPVTTVMTPTVYKDCWGSLSIYCYDIQPLDIPKYVKKLLF